MQPLKVPSKGNILIIALVTVVVLMIVGLILFYTVSRRQAGYQPQPTAGQVDEQTAALESLSNSDEVGAIEQDLKNTNLEKLDDGLEQITTDAAQL